MRRSTLIALLLSASLSQLAFAAPFSASEQEASSDNLPIQSDEGGDTPPTEPGNPAVEVMPPTPVPVHPVAPTQLMAAPVTPPQPPAMPFNRPAVGAATEPATAAQLSVAAAKKTAEEENPQISNTAVLQGLNKVTGHISKLEGPIGAKMQFGSLEIIPRRCWNSAPEDRPENAILLEVREAHNGEDSHRIFLGWMFSSSPGLSGLEHPVYDITAVACEYRLSPEKLKEAEKAAAEKKPDETPKAKPVKKAPKKKAKTDDAKVKPAVVAPKPATPQPVAPQPAAPNPATLQ